MAVTPEEANDNHDAFINMLEAHINGQYEQGAPLHHWLHHKVETRIASKKLIAVQTLLLQICNCATQIAGDICKDMHISFDIEQSNGILPMKVRVATVSETRCKQGHHSSRIR